MNCRSVFSVSNWGNRCGTGRIENRFRIKQILQHFGVVVHPIAIQISTAAPVVGGTHLLKIATAIHIEEVAVAILIESLKLSIIEGVFFPFCNIRSMGIENNIHLSDHRLYGIFKLVRVDLHLFRCDLTVSRMTVGVACKDPSVLF